MGWPDWITTLRERYLADRASVFVLHGAVRGAHWTIDGAQLDAIGVLTRFLAPTRQVIGVLGPDGLRFPTIGEAAKFERLVSAAEVVAGRTLPSDTTDPLKILGRIWLALGAIGTDQAWIVEDVDRLLPGHRRRVDPMPEGVPALFDWPRASVIRKSNNVVVFLTEDAATVRAELLDAAFPIAVSPPPKLRLVPEPEPEPEPATEPEDTATAAAPAASEAPAPPPAPPASVPAPADLHEAVTAALAAHDRAVWPTHAPVMDAVARVLHRAAPARFGALAFSVDGEDVVHAQGDGADDFLALWRSDIALDASAGMLVKRLLETGPEAGLDPTAMTALTRRVAKLLARVAPRDL